MEPIVSDLIQKWLRWESFWTQNPRSFPDSVSQQIKRNGGKYTRLADNGLDLESSHDVYVVYRVIEKYLARFLILCPFHPGSDARFSGYAISQMGGIGQTGYKQIAGSDFYILYLNQVFSVQTKHV